MLPVHESVAGSVAELKATSPGDVGQLPPPRIATFPQLRQNHFMILYYDFVFLLLHQMCSLHDA